MPSDDMLQRLVPNTIYKNIEELVGLTKEQFNGMLKNTKWRHYHGQRKYFRKIVRKLPELVDDDRKHIVVTCNER